MIRRYFAQVLVAVLLLIVAFSASVSAEEYPQVAFNFDFSFDFGAGGYSPPEVVVPSYLLLAGSSDNLVTPSGDKLTTPQ
jgi:hypothetical protein